MGAGSSPATRRSPNVVVVFADQMRASAVGYAGVEGVVTPHLDRLAGRGARFSRATSNTPICSPARASLLTGLHTLSHGVVTNDIQLRTDVTSIAHRLNGAGYRCGYIGKWHLDGSDRGGFTPPGPRRQGFDDHWAVANCNHHYYDAYYYLDDDPEPVWIDGYEPDAQTALAVDYIEARAREDDPFCLFLSWGPPHCPYLEVPRRHFDRYPPDAIRLKPNAPEYADRELIAGYYAHITALDENLGRITDAVERAGIAGDTIIVFTSDHGDMLFSQDRGWKYKPWQESVGVPLVIAWDGHVPAGRHVRTPVSLVDVMPTLLGLAGVAVPESVEGVSLAPLVLGESAVEPASVFIDLPVSAPALSYPEWCGVVTATHTYATFRDGPWIAYDDRNDPHQLHNLVGSKPLVAELQRELEGWLERLDNPFATSEQVMVAHCPTWVPGFQNETITKIKERRGAPPNIYSPRQPRTPHPD